MILGYVEQPSPRVGDHLRLRVSTDARRWRAVFFRAGERLTCAGATHWLPGVRAPCHLPFQDWGQPNTGLHGEPLGPWPAHDVPVPAHWEPGVYVAYLEEMDGAHAGPTEPHLDSPDSRAGTALFVLRPATDHPTANVLYKLPLFTYHAYNLVEPPVYDAVLQRGRWCLYNMPAPADVPVPFSPSVSVHRPGGGTGGTPYDSFNADPFDPTPRQTFVHWDWPMIRWLERLGLEIDFCTDFDLHTRGPGLLRPYRLLVSAGHDEYWSARMRDAVEQYTADGGNVAFFGGNTAWWRIESTAPFAFCRSGLWWETGRPENHLTGVSFRNGGERDGDEHPVPVGYRVVDADHWVFAGTGLANGDVFGEDQYLVGYECDGALFDRSDLDAGRRVVPTGEDGTPGSFRVLAVGDTRPSGWGYGNCAATLGVFTRGGTVFTAATTDWPRVLCSGTCPQVERITLNVLGRLAAPSRDPERAARPAS